MLNVQSPLATTKCKNRNPHDLLSPPREILHGDIVAAPECSLNHSSCSSDRTGCQIQRLPSINELDCLQRLRREEIERRNAELQSMSVMNKLMNNCGSFPFINRTASTCAQKNMTPLNSQDFDSDLLELMDDLKSDDESITLDCLNVNAKPRAPAPRLDIRPHRNFLGFQEEPVVILPAENEDRFVDLLPSPHSNKFVLQFPNAPTQELTLSDSLEMIEGKTKLGDRTNDFNRNQEWTDDKEQHYEVSISRFSDRHYNGNIEARAFRPVDSNTSLPVGDDLDSPGHSSSTSSSTEGSPTTKDLYQYHNRKNMISLRPKKRRSHSTIEINGCHSPRSSSCSSFEEENDQSCFTSSNVRPIRSLPRSMLDDHALDQLTRDLRLHDISRDRLDDVSSLSNRELDKSGTFLSLRPKRSRKPSIVLRAPYKDDHGDELMELNPFFSTRDFEKSIDNGMALNSSHDYDYGLTLHHYRCPSVSFPDENEYSNRSRTFSSNSLQGFIDIAKDTSSKFLGMTRQTSLGSFNLDNANNLISPSDLSESNFRTPNPESSRNRHSFLLRNSQSNLSGIPNDSYSHLDEGKKKNFDLLLPNLLSSASEDEIEVTL
jgi:hypothetical protein